jgi:hypothetical protein
MKTTGKPKENHRKTTRNRRKTKENKWTTIGKLKESRGKPKENHRKTKGRPKENQRKTTGFTVYPFGGGWQPNGHRKLKGKP